MRVLVTGGSGFIGSNLVPHLAADAEVLNLDCAPPRNPQVVGFWRECSVLDRDALTAEFRRFRPTHVVHMAARTDLKGASVADYAANVDGVRNVMSAIDSAGTVEHTLYTSSRLVFAIDQRPRSMFDYSASTAYGASKVIGEQIVRQDADRIGTWSIIRPTSIWGPWFDTPYRDFFDMVANGRYVKFRNRDPLKSFGYVGNAVYEIATILRADSSKTHQEVYWISDYEPLRLSEWADTVATQLGCRKPRYAPWTLARVGARAGDLATRLGVSRVPLTTFRLRNLVTDMVYDTSTTRAIVGRLPYSMYDGVDTTARWYKANAAEQRSL